MKNLKNILFLLNKRSYLLKYIKYSILFFLLLIFYKDIEAQTFYGVASNPADNGTLGASPVAVTPPASMVAGDLVVLYAQARTDGNTLAISQAGGQTWTSEASYEAFTTSSTRVFWCRYNGTWSANPSVSFSGITSTTVVMLVFRPSSGTSYWGINVNQITSTASTAIQTITGVTTTYPSTVTVALWGSDDDNTWGSLTGAGWSKTGLSAQYRNLSGSDQSITSAYYLQNSSTVGATGDVSQTQATLGADPTSRTILSWYEIKPPTISSFSPTSVCQGTDFTITGTNFQGTSSVTVNGVSASFTVNSTTQITATCPLTATSGNVVVTNAANSASSAITVLTAPTTAAAGTDFSVCPDATTVNLQGNTLTVGTGAWSVISGTGTFSNSTSPTSIVSGFSSGTNTYRWTSTQGACTTFDDVNVVKNASCTYCTPTSTGTGYPITNVNFASINNSVANPAIVYEDFTGSVTPANITIGQTYSLSVSATGLSPNAFYGNVFFDWNNDGDFLDAGEEIQLGNYTTTSITYSGNIIVPTNAVTGTIRMRVMHRYNAYATSCYAGANNLQVEDYKIVVLGSPYFNTQATNQTMCFNSSADFKVVATGAGALSYQWKYNGINVINGTPAGATYSGETTATLTVGGTIAAGAYSPFACVVTNEYGNATSNSVSLTVSATIAPDAPTELSATPQYLCTGNSSILSATVPSGTSLVWHSNSCDGTLVTSPVTPTITTAYFARAYDSGSGCYSSCTSIEVGVMDVPVIITNPESTYGCNGTSLTFTIVATGAGLTYQWQENAVNLSNGGVYSGVTTEVLTISDPTGLGGRTYRCVVTGACSNATSTSATLNVLGSGLSGTKTVGTGGDYTTLKAAFDAINSNGLIGSLDLRVISNTTETAEAILNQWNNCSNSGYTVTIYPTGATRTISGSIATSLITLNGADYVTFDGRIDKTGAANSLVLSNTNTSGSTLKFIADATYNTVKYCTLQGVSNTLTTGVVWFSTATTTGNDYNTITYCNIGDNGVNTPAYCIYASGTSDKQNDNITISYSNIYNFYKSLSANSGISVVGGNTKWSINNNSFYQTTARTNSATYMLYISNTNGEDFNIYNNYFGGSSASCLGGAMTYSSAGTEGADLYVMFLNVSNTGISNVYNNTVKNISWTGIPDYDNATLSSNAVFTAIGQLGRVDIYNNTIGDNSTGSITLTLNDHPSTADLGFIPIIYKLGNGKILNNTLGSITINGTVNDLSGFYGIYITGSVTNDLLVSGNTIGNSSTSNSIQSAAGLAPKLSFTGIYFGTAGDYKSSVTNNTIANISNNCTSVSAYLTGIRNNATAGQQIIAGNTILGLSTASTNTGYYSTKTDYSAIAGIVNTNSASGDLQITNNKIHSFSATGTVSSISVFGIVNFGLNASNNIIYNNFIHSFSIANPGFTTGIILSSGTAIVSNNMIRLGIKSDGTSMNTAAAIYGFEKLTSNANYFYYNSVYIGGNNTGAAQNTAAIIRWATGVDIAKNNIFWNARTGSGNQYAININSTTTFTSDYNDLYSSNASNLGSYDGGTTPRTFTAWKTGTAQDANSQNVDPSFTNATGNSTTVDLHLSSDASPMIDKGYYLSTILIDYDGQQRKIGPTPPNNDGNDPCIGADERIVPPSAQNSYGIFISDAQNGNIIDCEIIAIGGTPGGSGFSVYANGLNSNYANVGISGYQVISEQNIQCTNTNISFTTADGTPDWILGNGSSPSTGSTSPITTTFSTTGRKDIIESVKVFEDFTNITMETPSSGNILGAPAGAGCPTTYNYVSSVAGSAGFTYSWATSTPGGCSATVADPTSESTDITFVNTTGYNQVFTLTLDITSECCGPLSQVIRYITIWPGPLEPSVTDATPSICTGGSQDISVSSPDASYSYNWYNAASGGALLGSNSNYTINPVLTGTNSYYVEATNSFGCVSDRTEVVVTGNDTPSPTVPDNSTCGANDVTLDVTAPGASYTYNWYSSNCNGLLQSGTGSSFTTNITADISIWVTASPPGCGESSCEEVFIDYITPPNPIVWQGDVSTDWFNASNWSSDCLPTCGANVQIPNVVNDPDIGFNINGGAECDNIELQAGADLEFTDTRAQLTICGDFTHTGTVTTNNQGEIIFGSSNSAQNYTRTGTGDLHNVTINNTFTTPTITINSNNMIIGAAGKLSLFYGRIVTGSNNVIVSNTATTSVTGHSTASYVQGNLRRYIAASGSYDFPVGNATSYQLANLNISAKAGLTYVTSSFDNPASATGTGLPITETCWNSNAVLNNGSPGGNGGVWTVTPDAGTATYSLTLSGRNYDNAGLCHTLVSRANSGVAWGFEGSAHVSQSIAGGVVSVTRSGFTGFSEKAIIVSPVLLPIQLLYFTSYCNKYNHISWSTATELNNDYFIIEKSYDGVNFFYIEKILGSGNSSSITNYSYIDYSSNFSLVYYRLKQVDFDGKYSYSDIITTNCTESSMIDIFKSNNDDLGFIIRNAIPNKNYKIIIYDQVGKCLVSKNIQLQNSEQTILIEESLASGVYNVVIRSEDDFICKQFVIYNR